MTTPSMETGIGIRAESMSARPPTPQTPSGFITAKSIPENLCSSAIGPSFTNTYSTVPAGSVYRSSSPSSAYASRLVSMLGASGQQLQSVGEKVKNCVEAVLGARGASGEVDDEGSGRRCRRRRG